MFEDVFSILEIHTDLDLDGYEAVGEDGDASRRPL
mgnify:CR=1 FL=1